MQRANSTKNGTSAATTQSIIQARFRDVRSMKNAGSIAAVRTKNQSQTCFLYLRHSSCTLGSCCAVNGRVQPMTMFFFAFASFAMTPAMMGSRG